MTRFGKRKLLDQKRQAEQLVAVIDDKYQQVNIEHKVKTRLNKYFVFNFFITAPNIIANKTRF